MTKRYVSPHIEIDFGHNNPEWNRIRTSAEMQAHLKAIGDEDVARSNADLRAAQSARKQPTEDGYTSNITSEGSRARLYIYPFTARAIAHEAVNRTSIKNLPVGRPPTPPPDRGVPRELARRSDAVRNLDAKGDRIHRLDS
jgi:hypothetical protein